MGMEKYDEMARKIQEARAEYEQFLNGKKVAAMRGRKALQQIKRLAQEARMEIQDIKKETADQKKTDAAP